MHTYVTLEPQTAMSVCMCKEDLLNVFMKYRSRLQDLKLEPAMDVTKKQIHKDLTREIVEINGSKFSDHTKDGGEMDMLEGVLKRSLIPQLIKAQERASSSLKKKSDITPSSAPPQPPSSGNNRSRRLSTNFMDVMDDKLGQILKALSRTNSGADSYNKLVELFGLGGQFLVKPAALRNRPTKVMFSEAAQKCLVECYNNYEVVFLDENFSPLTGKKNIIMVETRLVEVIALDLDVVDDSYFASKRKSKRVLSITIPAVELELQEQQLDAEVRRKESAEDVVDQEVKTKQDKDGEESSDGEGTRERSNSMRRRRLRNRVAWSRGRVLGRGTAGATMQQRRIAELRFKLAQKKKKVKKRAASTEDLIVD